MRLQNIAMGRVVTNHDTSISSLSRNHRHQSHQTTLYKVRTCLQVSVSLTIKTTFPAFNPSHTKILGVRRWIALASWTRAMPQLLLWTCKISLSYIQRWECRLIQLMDSASNKTRCSKIRSMNILRTSSRWEVTQWHNLKAHQDSSWVCTEITWYLIHPDETISLSNGRVVWWGKEQHWQEKHLKIPPLTSSWMITQVLGQVQHATHNRAISLVNLMLHR